MKKSKFFFSSADTNMHRNTLYLKDTHKGCSLFTRSALAKGSFIAFYTGVWKGTHARSNLYSVECRNMSLTPYIRNRENHYAAMANEPSPGECVNATLLEYEFTSEELHRRGHDTHVAVALFATTCIPPYSEIMWYYGDDYKRDYSIGNVCHAFLEECEYPLDFVEAYSRIPTFVL